MIDKWLELQIGLHACQCRSDPTQINFGYPS
jgi:hypothetical protein